MNVFAIIIRLNVQIFREFFVKFLKHSGPDVKWVENGRPLFRIKLKLASSVLSTDPALQAFFFDCQRLKNMGTLPDVCENTKVGFLYWFSIFWMLFYFI